MNTPTEAGHYWARWSNDDYWEIVELSENLKTYLLIGEEGSQSVAGDDYFKPVFEWGERIDREEMQKKTETMNKMLADMKEMRQELNRLKQQSKTPLDTVP